MKQKVFTLWKFFIALSLLFFVISAASAVCDTASVKRCGDYCVHQLGTGCSGATVGNTKCEDVGCSTTCWGFWSNGGDAAFYQNFKNGKNTFHEDCNNFNVDVCVGPDGRTDYVVSHEKYYFPNGTEIICPQKSLPSQMYTDVRLVSLPMHITFGINDRVSSPSSVPSPVCSSVLYGYGYFNQSNKFLKTALSTVKCTTNQTDYVTHVVYRYQYDFTADFDLTAVVSDQRYPVPVLVGKGIVVTGQPNMFEASCAKDNLCYTEIVPD